MRDFGRVCIIILSGVVCTDRDRRKKFVTPEWSNIELTNSSWFQN